MLILACLLISMTCQQSRVQWRTTFPQQSACQCNSLICTTNQVVHDHIGNPENKTVKAIHAQLITYLYTGVNMDYDPWQHTIIAVSLYVRRHEGCNKCWSTNKFCPLTFLNGYNTIRGSWSCYWIIIKGPFLMTSVCIVLLVCKLWSTNSAGWDGLYCIL